MKKVNRLSEAQAKHILAQVSASFEMEGMVFTDDEKDILIKFGMGDLTKEEVLGMAKSRLDH